MPPADTAITTLRAFDTNDEKGYSILLYPEFISSRLWLGGSLKAEGFGDGRMNRSHAHLTDANFECSRMESAQLYAADLTRGRFWLAHLEEAFLNDSCLEEAQLNSSYLKSAILYHAHVKGARFSSAIIDSGTSFWGLKVNRHNSNRKGTDFTGVGLGSVRIDPGTKQLLKYNIRRMN